MQEPQRRRTAVLPKRSWIQRNPRLFSLILFRGRQQNLLRPFKNTSTYMESVKKAHQRLRNYPVLLGKCSKEATVYAACVTRDLNVEKDICEKEFQGFKNCLLKVAKEMKTKL